MWYILGIDLTRFREEFCSISSSVIIVFSRSVVPSPWTIAHSPAPEHLFSMLKVFLKKQIYFQ